MKAYKRTSTIPKRKGFFRAKFLKLFMTILLSIKIPVYDLKSAGIYSERQAGIGETFTSLA